MSKYSPLGDYLRAQPQDAVPLSFAEIAGIVGQRLPRSARYPAWWSNNDTNNVMTRIWLDAGFRTEQVDIEAERLLFRRQRPAGVSEPKHDFQSSNGRHPIFGALKGHIRTTVDLTLPADPDWGAQ